MTIFTDRDLERVANLQANWRQEFLLEVVRLRHERDIAERRETDAGRSSADSRSPTMWPAAARPEIGSPHN
jgi:hypothetical protein